LIDALADALRQLQAYGLKVDLLKLGPNAKGKPHRVAHVDDPKGKNSGWYVVHEFRGRNGRTYVHGSYGRFIGFDTTIEKIETGDDWRQLDGEELQRLKDERAAAEVAAREAEKATRLAAAEKARRTWERLPQEGRSGYLQRKRIAAFGVRFAGGMVVVPLVDEHGDLWSLQWIPGEPGASKKYSSDSRKDGCCCWLLPPPESADFNGVIAIGEGYASCASPLMATGWICVAAMDTNNLIAIAQQVRRRWPKATIVMLADNDRETATRPHMKGVNPGMACAREAAAEVGARVVAPIGGDPAKNFDWNDLHVDAGLDEVREQLLRGLADNQMKAVQLAPSAEDALVVDLYQALCAIPPDDPDVWLSMAYALKTLGARGQSLFNRWSARSPNHDADEAARVWKRITPDTASPQAVFDRARRHGWVPVSQPEYRLDTEGAAASDEEGDGALAPRPPDDAALDEPDQVAGEDALQPPPAPPTTLEDCLKRFELVYGGNKVWDTATDQEITYFSFSAMVGKELAKNWLGDSTRRMRIAPKSTAKGKGKRAEKAAADPTKLAMLLDRYALIYGTEAVFDRQDHIEITLAALRAFAGLQAVRAWTDHPHRKVVKLKQIVFNPRVPVDSEEFCNLWEGWPTRAHPGDAGDQELCRRWRAVLYYAVNNNDEVFSWLLKWMAYQVRYPGTKMKTSVIFHGDEGSGKNTVWDAFRRIFGQYGRSITQTQLESQYTDWMSGRLFIVGNEVLHRQEQVTQKGRLKTLITEDEFSLERKYLPGREEPNYCNLVFLSNETIPLSIDPGDRRFLVNWTPPPHKDGAKFYAGLSQKDMPDSAVSAIYHFLLTEVDLGDFGPHTKPPMTKAKQELIDASLPSAPRFIRDWKEGELEIPCTCCLTQSLYHAYQYWCRQNGEKFPWPENKFAATAKKGIRSDKKRWMDGQRERQNMFYLPDLSTRPPDISEALWLAGRQETFAKALSVWRNDP
jgi:phage/plasmid primase-like uncharacterized protein